MTEFINSARARIYNFIQRIIALISKLWAIPLLRYLVVGGINTIVGYIVFAILILLQLNYVLATLFAYIFSIIFNFKTHGVLTFRNKSNLLILRFLCAAIFIYLLNIVFLTIFAHYNINSLIAQAILILPLAFTSFLLMKKFVFHINIEP